MADKTQDEKDMERMALCRALSEAILGFAAFATKQAGGDPVEMMVALSTALIEANNQYAKDGQVEESFDTLIEGMITMHRHMMDATDEEVAMAEAMEEAFHAKVRGAVQ